jgi:hypothetical protein
VSPVVETTLNKVWRNASKYSLNHQEFLETLPAYHTGGEPPFPARLDFLEGASARFEDEPRDEEQAGQAAREPQGPGEQNVTLPGAAEAGQIVLGALGGDDLVV